MGTREKLSALAPGNAVAMPDVRLPALLRAGGRHDPLSRLYGWRRSSRLTMGMFWAFDNPSGVPDWLSDALCRVATGVHSPPVVCLPTILFSAMRPVILNGIEDTSPERISPTVLSS